MLYEQHDQLSLEIAREVGDALQHLSREILELLRHHDLAQVVPGRVGACGNRAQVGAGFLREHLELVHAAFSAERRVPAARERLRIGG